MARIVYLFILLLVPPEVWAQREPDRKSEKGFFSLGAGYGYGNFRLLNTDGSFSNYRLTGYLGDLDIRVIGGELGSARLFGSFTQLSGVSETAANESISSSELVAGLKLYIGTNFYWGGSLGAGNTKISSTAKSLDLKYQLVKALFGCDLQITESFFLGLELSYRSAPIRKNENTALTQNTYIEGVAAALRLIWSPPSVTFVSN